MSTIWSIGGQSLADLGLKLAGGTFRTGAASEMTLVRTGPFEAAQIFSYDQTVTLVRDGAPFFTGKVKSCPAFGSAGTEGQSIVLRDAWQDLEETIYLEPWAVGSGTFEFPIAVLGVNDQGVAISTGQQIIAALNFATAAGVQLAIGAVPEGIKLWPTEVRNTSVAEVIRLSSRLHPDWVPWINHASFPPVFSITPRATLATRLINLTGGTVTDFNMTRRDDLKPAAVRLTYTNATIIDGVTYRDGILDQYPAGGPVKGPRVLSAVVELAGGQMQFQKSRIQTLELPESQDSAKDYLRKKFPALKDVRDEAFNVTKWDRALVEEDEDDHPEPINPRARRLEVDDVDELPRELLRGTIEDWMQKKVGKVRIECDIKATGGATAEEKKKIRAAESLLAFTVTATNAVTKIYKGVTQWVAPEKAPVGIAQAVYQALSSYQYEGSVTVKDFDVAATRYHGTKLNLTGGRGEWGSMGALVHSAEFDIEGGTMTIHSGPSPHLAAEDFLELQRLLRGRPVQWMGENERTSNELGAEQDPGSKGDTVSGYDQPETHLEILGSGARARFEPYLGGEDGTQLFIAPGTVRYCRVAQEVQGADEHLEGQQVQPVSPTIDGTKLDDDEPAGFDISAKSNAAVWLITDRTRCPNSTLVPAEDSTETDRLELVARGAKPPRADGELHTLLCEMDFEAGDGGGKSITNLAVKRVGDVDVWFLCADDASDDSESVFGSSDLGSSQASDDPDNSSDSDGQKDCPWTAKAKWMNRRTCYNEGQPTQALWKIGVGLGKLKLKCKSWRAFVRMPGGKPRAFQGQRADGDAVVVQLGGSNNTFGALFDVEKPLACVPTMVSITLVGYPDPDDSPPEKCCSSLPPKERGQNTWPHYCGKSCTSIVPPP